MPTSTPRSVLVVDPEDSVTAIIARLLKNAGYLVHTERSLLAASRVLGQASYDVVVVSDDLAPTDQHRLLATEIRRLSAASLIVTTARASSLDGHPVAVGGIVILPKPFRGAELFGALAELQGNSGGA